ncbi:hypothetical protein BBO99_00009839 [Phytophthora kernoviae]|uniref:FYVE-type domain-containing protein n=2 Tax=Phytophthora kernoviae TaxID=325452 RepID=A0A421GBW5_9STRA|nr:hypothetical protein G195_010957 [Phytophthora kernoviae 00238/432]KAG2506168.1 hypothetical protein JM16_009190 [Phytophthora kernoviae]KAG2508546.1 hypothetical protein JM18_009210 [Phytophthora kernoviae]RLN72328.1 hypothetical protein BBO99_00009839 [Phytophthora kernoviae]
MPTKRFAHLLKPLECTEKDDARLRELAETLVVHSMEQYNSLELGSNGIPADKTRWKEIRRKEDTRVFNERATKKEPLEMPSLLLVGTVVGKLEDVIGIATSTKGERIGYHLSHSIGFDQVPSFASYNVTRTNMSVCSLYVQRSPSTVQTYARGYYDFSNGKNQLPRNASLNAIATHWLSFSRKIECAQVKKLLWMMYKNNNPASIMSLTNENKPNEPVVVATPGLCKVCSKSFGFLGTSRKFCKACTDQICSRCSVAKTVVKIAPNKMSVVKKKRFFCLQCFNGAVRVDAVQLAREEILNAKQAAVYY